jgi:WD40 repeat protein
MRHGGEIRHLQFNGEGSQLLSTGDDQTARIWDTRDGLPACQPLLHAAAVTAATFTPDGAGVVTACADGTTRFWEFAERQHAIVSIPHGSSIRDAELARGGAWAVTASADATARAYDAATGRPVSPPLHHKQAVTKASTSFDGAAIVTACAGSPTGKTPARLWSARDGWRGVDLGADTARFAAFIPRSDLILIAGDGWGAVWDRSPRRVSLLTPPAPAAEAALSPDGRFAAAVCENNRVRVWSLPDGRSFGTALAHDRVSFVVFCPRGTRLATCGNDGKARIWDYSTGRLVATVAHQAPLQHAAFSPDGTRLVTAGDDRVAGIWDAETGAPLVPQLQHDAPVLRVAFSPDGRLVATGCGYDLYGASGSVRLWDAATGDVVSLPLSHGAGVHRLEFSSDGRRLLTASRRDRELKLWAVEPIAAQLEQLQDLAVVFAGARLDGKGGQALLEPHEYARLHAELATRSPDQFTSSPADRAARLDREAHSFAATNDWAWALNRLDSLVAIDKDNLDFRRRRGEVHARLGHWKLAGDDYDLAADAESEDDLVWLPAAAVFARMEDWQRLRSLAARLLDRFGQTEKNWVCEYLTTIATLSPDAPRDPRVVALGERALKAAPGQHDPLTALGAALLRDGQLDRAAQCLTAALTNHPDEGEIDTKCLLSIVERRRGNIAPADRLFREAGAAFDALRRQAPDDLAIFWDLRLITEARYREAERAQTREAVQLR